MPGIGKHAGRTPEANLSGQFECSRSGGLRCRCVRRVDHFIFLSPGSTRSLLRTQFSKLRNYARLSQNLELNRIKNVLRRENTEW
jgi:hypothetical protein